MPLCRTSSPAAARIREVLKTTASFLRRFTFTIATIAAVVGGVAQIANAEDPPKLLESRESLYNNIYVYEQGKYISMTFGYNRALYTESIYNSTDDEDLPVPYTRFMTAALIYAKSVSSILEIGFGAGRTAWYLHRTLPNVPITSVELDPAVVHLAHKYFGIKDEANFRVVNQDGRAFLMSSKDHYDIILIDAYRGPFVPFHLLTQQFYQIVKDHLAAGGVVAQNVEPSTMLFDSAVKTIHTVFPQIEFYVAGGNVVTVAYNGEPRGRDELARIADDRQRAFHARFGLDSMVSQRRLFLPNVGTVDPDAKVLTDDFAPVDTLKAIENHNRKWPDKDG